MSTICICGVCIPVYALIPLAVIVLNNVWEWFRKNVLGQNDDHLFENSRVVHVKSVEQWKGLHETSKTTKRSIVVDFTASWCGPCRFIAPFFHELSNKYPCTLFLKVDVDEVREIASSSGVRAMPTFHFYKNGNKIDEQTGADKKALEERVKKHNVEVELPEDEKPQPKAVEGAAAAASSSNGGDDGLRQRRAEIVKVKTTEDWVALKQRAEDAGKTLVVDFWATWCGPCVKIAPVFESLSAKYGPSAIFAKVDVDEAEDVSAEENVNAMPTFKVFKQGKCVDSLEGAIPSALEAMVARHT